MITICHVFKANGNVESSILKNAGSLILLSMGGLLYCTVHLPNVFGMCVYVLCAAHFSRNDDYYDGASIIIAVT